jgi:virulence-associated protein VapD
MFFRQSLFWRWVAKGAEVREAETGNFAASHDEITRMLAEHGWNWIIDFVYFTTDIVSGIQVQFILTVFSSVLVSNDKPCRDANSIPAFVSLSLLNVQLVEKKK